MFGRNQWGGTLEISGETDVDEQSQNMAEMERASLSGPTLDETQQSWLLGYGEQQKKKKYVDLGCVVLSAKMFKWIVGIFICCVLFVGLIVLIEMLPKHHHARLPPDNYTVALHKALLFFNEQKSGQLTKANNVSWRGNSGMQDGLSDTSTPHWNLVGGYYDAGDQIKFAFPHAFAMTMLSWSVIEYSHKYEAIGELNHVKEIIRWGTDYILKTFNSSATSINVIYCQVGVGLNNSNTPDDHHCWMRPEDMDYPRPVTSCTVGSDLAAEMAAALAAASIVFKDDRNYSKTLVKGATTLFAFARDGGKRGRYSQGKPEIAQYYNSSGYYDEYMWGGSWMYYATGNSSYLQLVTTSGIAQHAGAFSSKNSNGVLSWDNKIPGAQVLLSRLRIFLGPGYPYEDLLSMYQNQTNIVLCSYLPYYKTFNRTKGGLIKLNHGNPQSLQYVVNAAFLAALYSDYLAAADIPGWYCGPQYYSRQVLRDFATVQVDYILGKNPMNMSYIVGYGNRYPKHVHHRAASIPKDGKMYTCTGGYKWRDSPNPNPHVVTGAMVGGPDKFDRFHDVRQNYNYTEPTIAGNAGLIAVLIALSNGDNGVGVGIDKNNIFSAIPPMFPTSPPPPPPWNP